MKFTLPKIKKLIEMSLTEQHGGDIGHPLMDGYYKWYEALTGHPNPYYKLFFLLSKEFKPGFVVELGSYRAGASGHFAVGHPQSIVVTIDIHKDPEQIEDQNACRETARLIPNLFYINKWSIDLPITEFGGECAINDVIAYNRPIDILFIDAWHKGEYVKREWEMYEPLLADQALIICDDLADGGYGPFVGMEDWWNSFKYQKFTDTDIHPGIPMGFMEFKRQNAKSKTTTEKTSTSRKTTQSKKITTKKTGKS